MNKPLRNLGDSDLKYEVRVTGWKNGGRRVTTTYATFEEAKYYADSYNKRDNFEARVIAVGSQVVVAP